MWWGISPAGAWGKNKAKMEGPHLLRGGTGAEELDVKVTCRKIFNRSQEVTHSACRWREGPGDWV